MHLARCSIACHDGRKDLLGPGYPPRRRVRNLDRLFIDSRMVDFPLQMVLFNTLGLPAPCPRGGRPEELLVERVPKPNL